MDLCGERDVRVLFTLADMPSEVLSTILAWLPASAVGACLAASRVFHVLSLRETTRYLAERIAQGATGACPRLVLGQACDVAYHNGLRIDPPIYGAGHARRCLPHAFTKAAATGALDLVSSLYRHAILLWYGDRNRACCIDPQGPDATRALVDIVRSPTPVKRRCPLVKPCVLCADFLEWLFRCNQPVDRFVGALPAALGGGHTTTAVWVGALASPFRLAQALDAASLILASTAHTDRPAGANATDVMSTDHEALVTRPDDQAVDDVVLACLWRVFPGTSAQFLQDAAFRGDLDALRRVLRAHAYGVGAFGGDGDVPPDPIPDGTDAAIRAAPKWNAPGGTLAWMWDAFKLADTSRLCQLVAKVAPECGLLDLGIRALCAFRKHTLALACERLVETSHRVTHANALAAYDDGQGLVGTEGGDLFDFIDNPDDDPATASVPCIVVSRAIMSGRSEVIDAALARWRMCKVCDQEYGSSRGLFCRHFWWRYIDCNDRLSLHAGLVHVVASHPRLFPGDEALGAIMCSPRADSLVAKVSVHFRNVVARDATKWIECAARNGCLDAVSFLLGQIEVVDGTIDTRPALVAAAAHGHFDVATLLLPPPTQRPSRESERPVVEAIEAAARAQHKGTVRWVLTNTNPRLHDTLWAVAAASGDVNLVDQLHRESRSNVSLCCFGSMAPYASIAIAHGHTACASLLLRCARGLPQHDGPTGKDDEEVDGSNGSPLLPANDDTPNGGGYGRYSGTCRPRPPKRRRLQQTEKQTNPCKRSEPSLAPSYVVDALGRGHTHAIDWATARGFRIMWKDVSVATALNRISDAQQLGNVLQWAIDAVARQELPRVALDLRVWTVAALASHDPIRIGAVVKHCPWREWNISAADLAKALCDCPVAMWRAIDQMHPHALDEPCFADAIVASGRVDLAVWMADERLAGSVAAFASRHISQADKLGCNAMASWLTARLVKRTSDNNARTRNQSQT